MKLSKFYNTSALKRDPKFENKIGQIRSGVRLTGNFNPNLIVAFTMKIFDLHGHYGANIELKTLRTLKISKNVLNLDRLQKCVSKDYKTI